MDSREEFLLKMYETSWKNIERTDELLWKFFTSYATLLIGSVILTDKVIQNPFAGLMISVLTTGIAICHSFNVNSWFMRNILIISNLEAVFLKSFDYGLLISPKWRPPYNGSFFNFKEFPSIFGFVYPFLSILIIRVYWDKLLCEQKIYLILFSSILLLLIIVYVNHLHRRFEELKKEAPGPI